MNVREAHMHQSMSIQISLGAHAWVRTGIYANLNYPVRCQLWEYLGNLRGRIMKPCTLIGDFNEIFLPSEQRGGMFSSARAARFGDMLDNCGLMDIPFFGSKFTWQRPCRGGRLVSKRLDRCVCDLVWRFRVSRGHCRASCEKTIRRQSSSP